VIVTRSLRSTPTLRVGRCSSHARVSTKYSWLPVTKETPAGRPGRPAVPRRAEFHDLAVDEVTDDGHDVGLLCVDHVDQSLEAPSAEGPGQPPVGAAR
jgi:hypothetical protein